MEKLRIGLLGFGQIGSGLYSIITSKKASFEKEIGVSFDIHKIAVRNKGKKRKVAVPKSLLTTNAWEVVRDPKTDIIVELIGGTREARLLTLEALKRGKHVVTANKALLAEHGDEIFELEHGGVLSD